MKIKNFLIHSMLLLLIVLISETAQSQSRTYGDVVVNQDGVMTWEPSNQEVKGFGVNYSLPFAHAYRSAQRMGVDVKRQIDNDLYHFKRLGFDLYRIHVWDTQISDQKGNLLENEHLDAFDYLIEQLKLHGFNYVITPIAFWGDGWPEPDSKTEGFSSVYNKSEALINPDAVKAQQNYLKQFLNHVNPYTKLALKVDPNTLAFEVSNEPHHRGDAEDVTAFVKGMVDAMKSTGTKKPIFYNMSHAVHFMEAYFKGGAQGGTFQWYPTGLGYGEELSSNLLPNVNEYEMPFDSVFDIYKGAKLVYEFDAADVGRSYIYPAMARSFRSAGIQIATHFAYDPTFLAPNNTEYNTHFMNLNYTPQKALALKIASKVFHEIPMKKDFGGYPKNKSFGNFMVNYELDLAVYNSEEEFIYTNSNEITPKSVKQLTSISGYGTSTIVDYKGTGAYFLDKINEGNWRLEVMPDAIWVDNPFGKNSPEKIVAVTSYSQNQMSIQLEALGRDFQITAINTNNDYQTKASGTKFKIEPGTYMVTAQDAKKNWSSSDAFQGYKLMDYYAPESNLDQPYLIHKPPMEISTNSETELELTYVSNKSVDSIKISGYGSSGRLNMKFENDRAYHYKALIPLDNSSIGFLTYHIIVYSEGKARSFPENRTGVPWEWDFYDPETYNIRVVPKNNPVYLFNAIDDSEKIVRSWRRGSKVVPTSNYNESEFQLFLDKLFVEDSENLGADPIYDYSFKHFVIDPIKNRKQDLDSKTKLVLKGRALSNKPETIQLALVMKDGSSYGKTIQIGTRMDDYVINLKSLKPVKTVTLPRPYPSFLPYYFEHKNQADFDLESVESIQFSIGPELNDQDVLEPHSIGIVSVYLN